MAQLLAVIGEPEDDGYRAGEVPMTLDNVLAWPGARLAGAGSRAGR